MSRRYESNPTLIRPSPQLFESTMRSLRSIVEKSCKDAWYMPLSLTKPSPDSVKNKNGMLRRLSVDSTVGDGLSIHPHGSWFEVSVGVKFTPKAAMAAIEEWAKGRYGSSRAKDIEEQAKIMLGMILANSTVKVISGKDLPPPVLSYDYLGNAISFYTVIISERKKVSVCLCYDEQVGPRDRGPRRLDDSSPQGIVATRRGGSPTRAYSPDRPWARKDEKCR